MPDPQTAKVAVDGKKVNAEDLPALTEFKKKEMTPEEKKQEDWLYQSDNITDFSKLSDVNIAINQIKMKKAVVNRKLKTARSRAAGAKYYYERAKRRQIVTVSGSSDRVRVAMAEIYTEELETDWIVASTEEEEYKSLLRNLTKEAEDLKELSYNIRRELDLL
jgi:hypothetical protein